MTDPNTTRSSAFAGWPIERIVPALAAGVTATGLALGELHAPQWRLLSAFAAANLALYAAVGWCPASALLTKAGVPSIRQPRIG
ncbi:YgaP-like transmembrane domain [Rhodococcoides fascians]|uniref:YgaP-like transmembrane domain n=1 Tax=Rhodococcoides fascians TaxID=1828 RepID=UPI00366F222D